MTLLGLSLQQLALLFGAVGTGITVLYILKLRRRRVRVPFAKLWYRVLQDRQSSSLFRNLRRLLSLLLQLMFLLLLTTALGDPRLSSEVLKGRRIILLVDTSASMKATDTPDGTRMAMAISRAKEIVRGMSGADTLMVVRMDSLVTPLSPFESDEKALLKILDQLVATDTRADLLRALKFCGDALRGQGNPMLILVSDGAFPKEVLDRVWIGPRPAATKKRSEPEGQPEELDRVDLRGIQVHHVAVGTSRNNVGIVAFNARRYVRNRLSFEIFLEVVNYRNTDTVADLQLLSDSEVIQVHRLSLKAGERIRFSCDPNQPNRSQRAWCDIAATGEILEARLTPPVGTKQDSLDAFPLDDRAYALLPNRKKQRVLLVTKGNLFLEGVLLLDPSLEVTRIPPASYSASSARKVDAVIFDGTYPLRPPARHLLVINPPEKGGPFEVRGHLRAPPITDQNRQHPVMRWVTLKDVNISSSAHLALEPSDQALASSFKAPLMVARQRDGLKTVGIGFDLRRSDLPLRVAFPLLILNSLDWFSGDAEEGLITSYRTGETWSIPLVDGGSRPQTVRVTGPDGRTTAFQVHEGRLQLYGDHVGLYNLRYREKQSRLAANLADAVESDIRPMRPLVLGGQKLESPTGFGIALGRELWIYLLLSALGLTLLEWLTYNRRITV